jgi:hypothetical protein
LAADGTVVMATSDAVYAVREPSSGTKGLLVWRYRSPEPFEFLGAPTVGDDGTVVVLGSLLLAIDGIQGSLKWSSSSSGNSGDPPTIAKDGTVYYGLPGLRAVRPPSRGTDGIVAWSFSGAIIGTPPAIATDGMLFSGGSDLRVDAISPGVGGAGPALTWSYRTGCLAHYPPAIGPDGTVYVAGANGDLFAFKPNAAGPDGDLKWRWYHQGEYGLQSSPSVGGDGTVYVAGSGSLYAISPPTAGGEGVLKWVFQTVGTTVSSAAIGADGTVHVTADDTLYAIQ